MVGTKKWGEGGKNRRELPVRKQEKDARNASEEDLKGVKQK